MITWRKKKCIRALGLDEADYGSDSEDGGPLSSLGHTTDGESLAGGSPLRIDHLPPSVAAVPSLYGSPVLPRSPLVCRPLLSPLVPPTTPPGLSSSSSSVGHLHSPARKQLKMPTTPGSHSTAGGYAGLHSPAASSLLHSPARHLTSTTTSATPLSSSSSLLLAT